MNNSSQIAFQKVTCIFYKDACQFVYNDTFDFKNIIFFFNGTIKEVYRIAPKKTNYYSWKRRIMLEFSEASKQTCVIAFSVLNYWYAWVAREKEYYFFILFFFFVKMKKAPFDIDDFFE